MLGGADVTELVNNLPWSVGSYLVEIAVKFTSDELSGQYNDLSFKETFEVVARSIEVEWSFGDETGTSFETDYNASDYAVVATITNIPTKEENGAKVVPTLTLNYNVGGNVLTTARDAGVYTVEVGSTISGSDAGNYSVPATAPSCQLTVKPYEVTVKANEVTNLSLIHIYETTRPL